MVKQKNMSKKKTVLEVKKRVRRKVKKTVVKRKRIPKV